MVKRFAFSGFAVLALAASGGVSAADEPGFYAGASIGQTSLDVDDPADFDNDDIGFKLFGGYAFNDYIALEAAYLNGGSPDQTYDDGSTAQIELTGFNVSAIGTLPLNEVFSVFGRLGFTSYDTEVSFLDDDGTLTIEGGDEQVSYGLGALFKLNPAFTLRAEYEMLEIDEIFDDAGLGADSTFLSLSGIYRF